MIRDGKYQSQQGAGQFQFGRRISLFSPCVSLLALNVLLCQHDISYSFSLLPAYARECGTKGMDEHRAGAKNVSVCRSLWARETRRKCLRKRKSWEEGKKKD